MFNKILIANRGEIACRIIETAHKLGVRCVALYSDADKDARHVAMADEAFHIGPSPSKDSYLQMGKILDVAKASGAEAIHPGYGFLSENVDFTRACAEQDVVFIGPPVDAIDAMGSKSAAKEIMQNAGVPLVPGYHGEEQDEAFLFERSKEIGYPQLLKAAYGGGGKGMRVVWSEDEFEAALASTKREAMAGFGNDKMLIERYLTKPRHVEIQVFADQHGNCIYLAERDCSIQRRHQKVLEEAPAPGLSPELRRAMGEAAVAAAKAINYEGAGTVEFLLDEDGSFYFMEMNTRLQVEHPVTEMITGQDLVRWQLLVAFGEPLPLTQEQVTIEGHAIEVRVYAEDPDNEFLPATGKLTYLRQPEANNHVRIDTGVRENDEVSTYYDPMISKLIVWDENRPRAIQRMLRALDDYRIGGLKTNLSFLTNLVETAPFQQAELDTGFIEKHESLLFSPATQADSRALALAALYMLLKQTQQVRQFAANSLDPYSPWQQASGWRLNELQSHQLTLVDGDGKAHEINITQQGEQYHVRLAEGEVVLTGALNEDHLTAIIDGHKTSLLIDEQDSKLTLFIKQDIFEFTIKGQDLESFEADEGEDKLTAPMNGTIVAILSEPGQQVAEGQGLIVMEAMKMEYTINAPYAGTVQEIYYQEGDLVRDGALLVDLQTEE